MARARIAVDIAGAPRLLRSILVQVLDSITDADIVELSDLPPDGHVDAVLICGERTSLASLDRRQTARLVAVSADGGRVTVHRPGETPLALSDASPDRIRDLLTGPLPRWSSTPAWTGGRPVERGAPPNAAAGAGASPTDALSDALAMLAARMVAQRGAHLPATGPGAELRGLLDGLSAAAPPVPPALPGLDRLSEAFDLREDERDFLLLACLVEVDARAARLVALLNDHMGRTRPTVGLINDFGHDARAFVRRLEDGPLRRFRVISLTGDGPLTTQEAAAPPDVWHLACGLGPAHPFPLTELPPDRLEALAAPDADLAGLRSLAGKLSAQAPPPVVAVLGRDDSGRHTIAEGLAAARCRQAVRASGGALPDAAACASLARTVRLNRAALLLTDAAAMAPEVLCELLGLVEAPVFLIGAPDSYATLARASSRPVLRVQAPERDAEQRLRIWRAETGGKVSDEVLAHVADRFDFGVEAVARAHRIACAEAEARSRGRPDGDDLLSACDRLRQTRFEGAAERLPRPWSVDDIVLRPDTRAELDLAVAWAEHGRKIFAPGGAGAALRSGGGLACLFSGPPGTGKTMAAQIIARQVDYALYRIDLSQVVDKFIGESEKRLSAVFDEAERSRVALFFDEADALFGKRTEVRDSHDRYANITIDYLLQRLDEFEGLAILATNLAGNIDDAFMRRVRVRAEFPAPGPAERRLIWQKLLPPEEARGGEIDIPRLANPFEIVGGEIRNAIYTAHLLAAGEGAAISMRHCVRGLWRELGKIGRMSDRAHLGPWQSALDPESVVALGA